jgi:hypothetical protein
MENQSVKKRNRRFRRLRRFIKFSEGLLATAGRVLKVLNGFARSGLKQLDLKNLCNLRNLRFRFSRPLRRQNHRFSRVVAQIGSEFGWMKV